VRVMISEGGIVPRTLYQHGAWVMAWDSRARVATRCTRVGLRLRPLIIASSYLSLSLFVRSSAHAG
jgi:hypothetical protein